MKKLFLLMAIGFSLLLIFQNCQKNSDSATNSVTVAGKDLSGTWKLSHVECYSSPSLATMTNSSTYSGNFTDVVVVSGNSVTGTISNGICTIKSSATVVFQQNTMSLKSRKIISVTGGSCSINKTLSNAAIGPSSMNITNQDNQALADVDNASYLYISNIATPTMGLLTTYSDQPGSFCYELFYKQ